MSSGYEEVPTDFVPLAVSKPTFLGLLWASVGVSLLFVLFRGYVRLKVFRQIFLDDVMIFLAWVLVLVNACIWLSIIDYLYLIYKVSVGAVQPPADILSVLERYIHRSFAVTIISLCSLWAVKASFLIFFHKLGHNVRGIKAIWWAAVVACIIGFIISIGVQNYECVGGPVAETAVKCNSPSIGAFIRRSLQLQAACDVITDCFILAVPLKILWKVQISVREKIALVVLFSLTLFTMIVAIIKVTLTLRTVREDDSWLYMWAAIESAVAIIIASAISYRPFFHKKSAQNKYSGQTIMRPLHYGENSTQQYNGYESSIPGGKASSVSSAGEEAVPLDTMHGRPNHAVFPASELESGRIRQAEAGETGQPVAGIGK